jgi:hypothetical protein
MNATPLLTAFPAPPGLLAALNGPLAAPHQSFVASGVSAALVLFAPNVALPKMQLSCAATVCAADPLGNPASATSSPVSKVVTRLLAMPRVVGCALPMETAMPLLPPAALLLRALQPSATKPVPTVPAAVPISPYADGLACPQDMAVSPAGHQLAVLGHARDCNGAALVSTYDLNSRKLGVQFSPEGTTRQAAQSSPSANASALLAANHVVFDGIAWSPDGARLALPFHTARSQPNGSSQPPPLTGVLLALSTGADALVLTRPAPGGVFTTAYATIWDTATKVAVPSSALAAAVGYQWGAQGGLLPLTLLNATSPPPTPPLAAPGNPRGGAAFSVWQPGMVSLQNTDPATGQMVVPGVYVWVTTFLAWSPDQRYLREIHLTARLIPSGISPPSQQTLQFFHQEQAPILPTQSAALRRVLADIPADVPDEGHLLAWRPDGRMLAVAPVARSTSSDLQQHAVTLYDAATGEPCDTLMPQSLDLPQKDATVNLLRWSPDGANLLLYDQALSTITLWDRLDSSGQASPSSCPHA